MVKGLDIFKEHFSDFTGSFVIIGGTACSLLLEGAGLTYRVTKDIDIILYTEVLDAAFGRIFWDFIRKGGYTNLQKSTGEKAFYRFCDPSNRDYPEMLELFSSKPEGFIFAEGSKLTSIPFDEEISSLSAILLDADYYNFIRNGRKEVDGLPVLGPEYLIPLKAKAYLDLSKRELEGKTVDSKNIKKHQNDVFRLFPLLAEETWIPLPPSIANDMRDFIRSISAQPIELKRFGILNMDLPGVLNNLKAIFNLH